MNNQAINTSAFGYSSFFFNSDFEDILKGIIECYYCVASANAKLPNNENLIRDELLSKKYLKSKIFKKAHPPLHKYQFDKETAEDKGRVDIRILYVDPYKDDDAYYVIECKRLNNENTTGTTGLNAEYISEGIARFASEKYSMYENTAGMIGFVVEKMDIPQNISAINTLLSQHFTYINTEVTLTYKAIASGFKYSYFSKHKIAGISKIIYHLMFDFSENV